MGTFQLGRVGLENTTGEIHGWSSGGSGIKVSGHTQYGSVAEALVVREQLLGYVEQADEDFVPVVWSEQPEVNGFYRVSSVSVDSDPDGAPFGVLNWSADLERVQGFAAPLIEISQLGVKRTDDTGWSSFVQGFGIPADSRSALEAYRVAGVLDRAGVVERFTRFGEQGDALVCSARSSSSTVAYYVAPDRFYEAAATLRIGNPSRVVVGRQPPNISDVWSLTNGLLEVRPSFSAGFTLEYRMWAGSVWSPWESLTFRIGALFSVLGAPHTITVLRNAPEQVTVRLQSSELMNPVSIDLTLRRGQRYVHVVYGQAGGFAPSASFSNFSSPGDIDPAGWEKTVSGVTKFCASNVPTNSPITYFSPSTLPIPIWQFCFGLTDDAEHGTHDDIAAYSVNEWFWAATEKQSVVAQ